MKFNNQYKLALLICFIGLAIGHFTYAQESRSSSDFTVFGDTLFQGKWSPRGVSNQAGQVAFADYDLYDSSYTFITTEGYIFTTKESAIDWVLLNPQNIFDHPIVGFSRFSTGGKTYLNVVSRDGVYYHSADAGKSWVSGIGIKAIEGFATVQKLVQAGNGDVLLLLEEKLGQADITLYESNDFGASFSKIKTFRSPIPLALNNYDISKPIGNDSAILILYVDTFSIYNVITDSFNFHSKVPAFSFREARIIGSFSNGDNNFYLCRGGSIYQYDRINSFWNRKSQISFESRLPHTFSASRTNTNSLFIGDYNFHKSSDTAKNWSIQNTLNEFLINKNSKLHPGINSIESFENVRQSEIFLIATDGGLFLSQDQLNSVINLTPNGIQIGNHYDLEILKDNDSKLYTSSESQGLHTYKNYNPDSTINTEHIAWGTNYELESSKAKSNLWAASGFEIGLVSSVADRFYRTTWKYSDTFFLGGNKPILVANPNISTEAFCTGFYNKTDPDKKSYIYKLTYDGSTLKAEQMDKNFNLNFLKTEFISAFEISSINDSNWYVITNDGNFYGSVNAGKTWKRSAFFNGLLSNEQFGSTILASPITEGLIYVGGRGNGNGSIYYSQNFGKDFKLLGNGLKNTEVFGISSVNNDSLQFAATKDGPFVYSEKFGEWESLLTDEIPIKNWTCVQAYKNENTLWFGTFGRGLWEFDYRSFKDSISSVADNKSTVVAIQLYPNPTNGILKIETFAKFESVSIFSIEGKKVESFIINNPNEIDIQSLETGIYLLRFQLENGQVSNHKIIKE